MVVAVQPRTTTALRDNEIEPAVGVVVGKGTGTLVAVNCQAGLVAFYRREVGLTEATQPEAAPGVEPVGVGRERGEILRKEQVVETVAVEVSHRYAERGRQLRLRRQRFRLETIGAIQEQHRLQHHRGHRPGRRRVMIQQRLHAGLGEGTVRLEHAAQAGVADEQGRQVASRQIFFKPIIPRAQKERSRHT